MDVAALQEVHGDEKVKGASGGSAGSGSSEDRADAFAQYLEAVQWCQRPLTLQPDPKPNLFPRLNVADQPFPSDELRKAVFCRPSGQAFLDGDVPIEYLTSVSVNE